jgi:seryl-tRNA synthetase
MRGQRGQKAFPVTLNASGLPIGRTMAALLEQGQQADGSVVLPAALVPYAGFARISRDGEASPARRPAAAAARTP